MKDAKPLYNNDGSARVCRIEIRGTGRVDGSFNVEEEENDRLVDERPCNVKGKSRKRAVSGGLILT